MPAKELTLNDPVRAMHQVSADLALSTPAAHRRRLDAVARSRSSGRSSPPRGGTRRRRVSRWSGGRLDRRDDPRPLGGRARAASSRTPSTLLDQLDWVAKQNLIEAYRDRHGCQLGRPPTRRPRPAVPRPARRSVPSFARLSMERLVSDGRGRRRGHRAAEPDPGLVPGPLPVRVAGRRGHRELGLARIRPRYRPAAPRPYDGPAQGNGGAHGLVVRCLCDIRQSCWTD